MERNHMDGAEWLALMRGAYRRLAQYASFVNALNVYPVPDGDTGTNMSMSLQAGLQQMEAARERSMEALSKALSYGLLMGARGNSGVILSQLCRGLTKRLSESAFIDPRAFAEALQAGVAAAYGAVAKPVEGTMLTVARRAAEAGMHRTAHGTVTMTDLLTTICEEANRALADTPKLLAQLAQAGVVDSGGQGLTLIFEGFLEAWTGVPCSPPAGADRSTSAAAEALHDEFGYCTEFVVKLPETEDLSVLPEAQRRFGEYGESLLVIVGDGLLKVHLHTEHPGRALEDALRFGPLLRVKIENMAEQHHSLVTTHEELDASDPASSGVAVDGKPPSMSAPDRVPVKHRSAVVAVSMTGSGLEEAFRDLGAYAVVDGGDTMNPSTEDLLRAVEASDGEVTIILPNHKNVRMAADQAAALSERNVVVLPTQTILEGIAALVAHDGEKNAQENERRMLDAVKRMHSAGITRSARAGDVEGEAYCAGDYIVVENGEVCASATSVTEAYRALLDHFAQTEPELVTVILGKAVSEETLQALRQMSQDVPFEVEWIRGDQALYDILAGAEG